MELEQMVVQVAGHCRVVGAWMKEQTLIAGQEELKSHNNLVTYVDRQAEHRLVQALLAIEPGAGIIAEEGTGAPNVGGLNWVIDPLDGTTNFIHGLPLWCISIALVDGTEPLLGVIHDPNSNECFTAVAGGGAHLNQEKIHVSSPRELLNSLIATGFPYDDFGREKSYMQLLQSVMHTTRGVRRLGSAAIDLAWVACGRFEAFYEYGLNAWDVAAGALIVREAGGTVTGFSPSTDPIFGEEILASNGAIHDELLRQVHLYFS